ncbi:MAG: chemotaxis response regulator protein-glutamate methylesterase [Verrucomicrobia bacterium]|nr:chemotaxis response regulator protein-glutamate methylesterase [Verrucomicrobiota bacterium]
MGDPVRVLIVDDSSFMRKALSRLLSSDPAIEVIGTAPDGRFALRKIEQLRPDVVTLDVEMPGMDGITTLREIMRNQPVPVLMVSSLTQAGAAVTISALSLGAVDFVPKPSGQISLDIENARAEIIAKVKAVAKADLKNLAKGRIRAAAQVPKPVAVTAGWPTASVRPTGPVNRAVAIGVSTGGPQTLMGIVPRLPADLRAPVMIVQHMPEGFTRTFAERLDQSSALTVKEAEDGDHVSNGCAYLAPGGSHMTVTRERVIRISKEPYGTLHKPSVDVMMESVIDVFGSHAVGVLLTGMGKDGAESMAKLRRLGGRTIAESEETAVVYGMPREAVQLGGVEFVLPADRVADQLVALVD